MGMTIVDALVVTLGLDASAFKRGKAEASQITKKLTAEETRAAKEIEERNKRAADSFRRLRTEVLALVSIFTAGVGIKAFTENTINSAVNLGFMAKNLQMSTRDLSAWQRAAQRAGGSAEGITAALQASQGDISKLKFGQMTEGVQWFLRMGGSVNDLRDGNSYLLARSRIIKNMFDIDPGRARFVAQSMGIGDEEFNFLKQGPQAVLALVDAQKKNSAITEQQAEAALKLKNEWLDLRDRLQYVGTTILLELMPTFEKWIGQLQKASDWVADHKDDISRWLEEANGDVRKFVTLANEAADAVGGWKNVILALGALKVLSIMSPLLRLAGALGSIGTGLGAISTAGPAALGVLARVLGIAGLLLHSESLNTGEGAYLDEHGAKPGQTWTGDAAGDARRAANSGTLGDRQRYLMQRLKAEGYSDAQAAGIIGSLQQESGLDPTAVNKVSGNTGLAQWGKARATQFQQQFGHSLKDSTFGEQVDFMLWELKNTEKLADKRIRMAQTPAQAAEIHAREYERPGAAEANIARRQAYASALYAGVGQANAAQIAGQTAVAALPPPGTSSTTNTSHAETHVNGPINVYTQATDAKGIARDFGQAVGRYTFLVPHANTGVS